MGGSAHTDGRRTGNLPSSEPEGLLVCGLPTSHRQDGSLRDARASSRWHEQDGSSIAAGMVLARDGSRGAEDTEVLQGLPSG